VRRTPPTTKCKHRRLLKIGCDKRIKLGGSQALSALLHPEGRLGVWGNRTPRGFWFFWPVKRTQSFASLKKKKFSFFHKRRIFAIKKPPLERKKML